MDPAIHPDALDAWRMLVNTSWQLMRRLDDDLARNHGISLPAYDVLISLNEAPDGRLRQQDLLHEARLSKSGMSRLADRLEEAHLIRHEECPSDRRGAYAVITDTGRSLLQGAQATQMAVVRDLFWEQLGDADARELARILRRVAANLPAGLGECQAARGIDATASLPAAGAGS